MQTTGRRHFLLGATAIVLAGRSGAAPAQMRRPGYKEREALMEDLVAANRILAAHGVVDAFGHVSARVGTDRYLLSRSLAPEQVTAADIMEFDLDNAAQNYDRRTGYLERFIHGQVYRARPDVMSVVHCHTASLIPFSITKAPLRPVYHNSSFVGEGVPVFEIRDAGGDTDMLVGNNDLGKALASTLADKPAVLMRGHGAVVVGKTIMDSVARSIYLEVNARVQSQAMALGTEINYLSPEEVAKRRTTEEFGRPWALWKSQVAGK